MLLTKKITLKCENAGHVKIIRKMGFNNVIIGVKYSFDIKKLSLGSHLLVDVKCDFCGKKLKKRYQTFNREIKNGPNCCGDVNCMKLKRKLSINKKYGINNVFQLDDVKDKMKITNQEKYGCDNPHQNEEIKEKAKQTCVEKYGFENVFQNEEIKEKIKHTNMERYGVEYIMQNPNLLEKSRQTNLKNLGVEWPTQNRKVFEKAKISLYKIGFYKGIRYQASYELDFLKKCDELNILNLISKDISIPYILNEEQHVYHPDYYLEKYNLIIEIKSCYWYEIHKEDVDMKEQACKELEYNYLMILDKNYELFKKIIKSLC